MKICKVKVEMNVHSWTCEDVGKWMEENGFGQYKEVFSKKHKIDGQVLLSLSEQDLRLPPLQMKVLGDLKRLMSCIKTLQNNHDTRDSLQDSTLPNAGRVLMEKLEQNDSCIGEKEIQAAELILECAKKRQSHNLEAEIKKTLLSFLYVFTVFLVTSFVMVVVHDRVPDMDKYPPLPDIFLDNMPFIPWAFKAAELIGVFLGTTWFIILIFHKHRFILMRRMFSLMGTIFLLRCISMLITSLSVPGVHLKCEGKLYPDLYSKLRRTFEIWTGLGMTLSGVRTCGDYMFSGHSSCLTCLNFFITEYTPRSIPFLHTTSWIANIFGLFFILAAHEHYSLDVFVAFYLTSRLFMYYHTLANTRSLMTRDKRRTRIWFPLFAFFESRCDGKVPNEYEWPLPSLSQIKSWFKKDSRKKCK